MTVIQISCDYRRQKIFLTLDTGRNKFFSTFSPLVSLKRGNKKSHRPPADSHHTEREGEGGGGGGRGAMVHLHLEIRDSLTK